MGIEKIVASLESFHVEIFIPTCPKYHRNAAMPWLHFCVACRIERFYPDNAPFQTLKEEEEEEEEEGEEEGEEEEGEEETILLQFQQFYGGFDRFIYPEFLMINSRSIFSILFG